MKEENSQHSSLSSWYAKRSKPTEPLSESLKLTKHMEHGIFAYVGGLGSGKTYAMTCDVVKALDKGERVITNYEINWKGNAKKGYPASNLQKYTGRKQITEEKGCIFALDEGYIEFDSYEMTKMSLADRMAILLCRKRRVSIWYTTQRPMAVHKTLRSMTNIFYKCEKVRFPFIGIVFRKSALDLANENDLNSTPLFVEHYRAKKKMFDMYDTYEIVEPTNTTAG